MLDPTSYPPAVAELLGALPLAPLGPGTPNEAMRPALEALTDLPATCRAGLWLAFDFLDESHRISQDVSSREGSYWHGILHRREPDYSNAKYWFRQVGEHPIHPALREAVIQLATGRMWPTLLSHPTWDAAGFVDLCEKQADPEAIPHRLCRQIQRAEWELLFAWCYAESHHQG